jgi:hypothetical protein
MNEKDKIQLTTQKDREVQEDLKSNEDFKSRFSIWIRIVAWIVVIVFVPEQIAWAIEYNPAVIWRNMISRPMIEQAPGGITTNPALFNEFVAKSVRRFLKPLVNKKLNRLQLKPRVNVNITNPQDEARNVITKVQLKKIYEWLNDPETETLPCSAYVLYNLLKAKRKDINVEELSILLILIDILSGNINADTSIENPRYLNSLYALEKTAQYFDLQLYSARLKEPDEGAISKLIPFIAHLYPENRRVSDSNKETEGHFVLVTEVKEDKVYYFYDKGNTFLPREKFLERFSGYCLVTPYDKIDNILYIGFEEAKSVKGAGDWDDPWRDYRVTSGSYYQDYNNYSPSYTGFDYRSNNTSLDLTRQTSVPLGINVTVYDAGKPQTVQEVWGFNTRYTDTANNYSSFNTRLNDPVLGYYSNNTLIKGKYGSEDLKPGSGSFVSIPMSGVNEYAVKGANGEVIAGSVPYATMSQDYSKFDDRATIWIGNAPTDIFSYSMNLNKNSFYATNFDKAANLPVWNTVPLANTILNPGQVGKNYTPPSGAPVPVASQFMAYSLSGAGGNNFFRMGQMSDGAFQINVTNAGVTMRQGSAIQLNPADYANKGMELIPGQTFMPTSESNRINFYQSNLSGRSLVVQPVNMQVTNTGLEDVRWLVGGPTEITNGLGVIELQSNFNMHFGQQGIPKTQDLNNAAKGVAGGLGYFQSRSNEGISATALITDLVDNAGYVGALENKGQFSGNISPERHLVNKVESATVSQLSVSGAAAERQDFGYKDLSGEGSVRNRGKESFEIDTGKEGKFYIGVNQRGLDATPTLLGRWALVEGQATLPIGNNVFELKGREADIRYNTQSQGIEFGGEISSARAKELYNLESGYRSMTLSRVAPEGGIPLTNTGTTWQLPAGTSYKTEFSQIKRYLKDSGKIGKAEVRTDTATTRVERDKLVVEVPVVEYSAKVLPDDFSPQAQRENNQGRTNRKMKHSQWNTQERQYGNYRSSSVSGRNQPAIHISMAKSEDSYVGVGAWDVWTPMTLDATHNFENVSKYVSAVQYDKDKIALEVIPAAHTDFDLSNPQAEIPYMTGHVVLKAGVAQGTSSGPINAVTAGWGLDINATGYVTDERGDLVVKTTAGEKIRVKKDTLKMQDVGYEVWGDKGRVNYRDFGVKDIAGSASAKINSVKINQEHQPVIDIRNNKLFLSQMQKPKSEAFSAKDSGSADTTIKSIATLNVATGIIDRQDVLFNIANFTSPFTASLSADLRNLQINTQGSGRLPLVLQMEQDRPVGLGGVILEQARDKLRFDSSGSLIKDTAKKAGFLGSINNRRWGIIASDAEKNKALVDARGYLEWDKKGRIKSADTINFERMMTAADVGKWHGIKRSFTELLPDGRLSITANKSTYTFFVSSGSNQSTPDATNEGLVARRAEAKAEITKEGHWRGQASFYLSSFTPTFSSTIDMDTRNYSGISHKDNVLRQIIFDDKGKEFSRKYLDFTNSDKFTYDKRGNLTIGNGRLAITATQRVGKFELYNEDRDQRLDVDPRGAIYYRDGQLDTRRTDIQRWVIDLYTRAGEDSSWRNPLRARERYYDEAGNIKALFDGTGIFKFYQEARRARKDAAAGADIPAPPESKFSIKRRINEEYVEAKGKFWVTILKQLNGFETHTHRNAQWSWPGVQVTLQEVKGWGHAGTNLDNSPRLVRAFRNNLTGDMYYFPQGNRLYFNNSGSTNDKRNSNAQLVIQARPRMDLPTYG